MERSSVSEDSIKNPPMTYVADQFHYAGDRRHHDSKERVYGKTSRRKAIANLRGIAINEGHFGRKLTPEQKQITLQEGLANQAAKLHDLYAPDNSRSLKPRIPSEKQIMSMLRLGVETCCTYSSGSNGYARRNITPVRNSMVESDAFLREPTPSRSPLRLPSEPLCAIESVPTLSGHSIASDDVHQESAGAGPEVKVGSTFLSKKRAYRATKAANSDGLPFEEAQVASTTIIPSTRQDIDKGIKSDVTQIRKYMDLLDEYSLHHFVIWQGKAIRDTPKFISLARTQPGGSSFERYVTMLEEIMTMNAVPLAVIDGKKLADLARFDLDRIDEADLCYCIENLEHVRPLLYRTKLTYSDLSSIQRSAAVKIQALARRFFRRFDFLNLRHERSAAIKLQCFMRCTRSRRLVFALLAVHRTEAKSKWEELQASLRANWASWRNSERVLVILHSNADDPPHDLLTSCALWLVDPKMHVVCILPCLPGPEVLEYNRKLFEITGICDAANRMTIVIPENVGLFQNYLSLAASLLYSPISLKRIGQIMQGRPAIILSAQFGCQSKRLALALGVPLLSAEPAVSELLQSHTGMRNVFSAADVSIPLGAHDAFNEDDIMISLSKLIACNLYVRKWYIKIDACRGNRGLAIMDTSMLPCMIKLRREKMELERENGDSSGIWHLLDVQLLARARILETLRRCLHRTIYICRPDEYQTWTLFLGHMARVGGVIEAEAPNILSHPSASVFVSPTGKIISLTEGEMLYDASNEHVGCVYPQECVPPNALRGATMAISLELYSRGVVGYVSIHFVVFCDGEADSLRLWATELELGLSTLSFGYYLFRLFTRRTKRFRDLGWFEEAASPGHKGRSLGYVYLDQVRHPNLQSSRLPMFFKLCRLEAISFDLAIQVGTIFDLGENLIRGVVGLLVISDCRKSAVERTMDTLKFIKHIGRERHSCGMGTLSKEMCVLGRELKRLQGINPASSPSWGGGNL